MKQPRTRDPNARRKGTAIVMMVLAVSGLAALSAGLLVSSLSNARQQTAERTKLASRFVTQAGLTQALYQLRRGQAGDVGTRDNPVTWAAWRFWVSVTKLGNNLFQLEGTGLHSRGGDSLELIVRRIPNPASTWGAFGHEYLRMNSNAMVDAYDSRLGTHASQGTGTYNSMTYAVREGNVGSNGSIQLDSNAAVWGNSTAGPGGNTSLGGNSRVSGSVTPATVSVPMPSIVVPTIAGSSNLNVNSNRTIGPGDLSYGNVSIDGSRTLTVVGPARIVVNNLTNNSDARLLANTANGPVEFWVRQSFVIDSNAIMRPVNYDTTTLKVNLLSNNVSSSHTVRMDSNGVYYGTILAPNARVVINSNFQLYGSCVARSMELDSNAFFHFDKALLDVDVFGPATWSVVMYREIAFQGGPGLRTATGS